MKRCSEKRKRRTKDESNVESKTINASQEERREREKRLKQKDLRRRREERYRREMRRKKRRRKIMAIRLGLLACMMCLTFILCFGIYHLIRYLGRMDDAKETFSKKEDILEMNHTEKPEIVEDFLTPNPYSRPGEELLQVNNIFVHYTANPGTSAAQNRSYFENMGVTGETSASAHFVIGYDGEIIQCIPLNEIGYAVKERNYDSVSIECCYLDSDGRFTDATYESLIHLCGWLLKEYDLTPADMRRHYDEGGKKCPLYYVEHEDAWEQFLNDLYEYIT